MRITSVCFSVVVLLVLFVIVGTSAPVWGQQARLTGTVLDGTGAAIPDAEVSATNISTGLERATRTTGTGAYSLPNLIPSTYTVTITKTGFKTVKFTAVNLTIDQILTLDARLDVSSYTQQVEVSSAAVAPVDLEDGQISNVVDSAQTKDLPLILRDPYQLVLLSPGEAQSNTRLGGFSTNGQREINNNFLLDGLDNNDTDVPSGGAGLIALNPDSTQEFRVITNNFAPEYGRDNGAIIDVKSPSGTNSFHGAAVYFGRYDALGARDFFNHQPDTPKDPYVRNTFGGSFGGPIIHDKTFFFVNYEGNRFITTLTNTATVPTEQFKTGIFTYSDPNNPTPVPINVTVPMAGNNASPFGLDPAIQKVFALYPAPNAPGPNSVLGQLFYPSSSRLVADTATARIDHQLTTNNAVFVRYNFNRSNDPDPFHDDVLPGDLGATSIVSRTQSAGVGLTTTINSRVVNEVRFGANRNNAQFHCNGLGTLNSFGLTDVFGRGTDFSFLPPSNTGISDLGCIGNSSSEMQGRWTGTYQIVDNISYSKGSHSFKFGGEFRDAYSNSYSSFFSRITVSFDPFGQGLPVLQGVPSYITSDPTITDAVGSLLGYATQETQNQFFNAAQIRTPNDERGFRQHEVGLFAQDSWKIKSNLTVTYGMRWEYFGVPYEVQGNFSTLFADPTGPAPFTFTTLKRGGAQIYKDNYRGFDPRLGVAWDPFKTGKTSVRAGWGIFRERVYGNLFENTNANPPFLQQSTLAAPAQLNTLTAPTTLITSNVVPDFSFLGPSLFAPNYKLPVSQNWNLGIERQFAKDFSLEVNYVGVHGYHEARSVDANPPNPALVQQLLAFCVPGNPLNVGFSSPDDPTSNKCDVSTVTGANLWVGDFFGSLPFPAVNNRAFASAQNNFVSGGVLVKSIAYSNYNGLQVNAQKRYSRGLQIQLAYTYSHSLDNGSDPINSGNNGLNRTFPRNSLNLRPEYGNSDYDVRHRAVLNFIWDPNIGRGKDRLNRGITGRILEGWEIAGIAQWQTGLPYDVYGFRDTQHTGFSDRATLDDPSMLHTKLPSTSTQVFTGVNAAAFNPDTELPNGGGTTPWGIVSNLHRNQFFGPGANNWDAVLTKNTSLTERFKFQLRFEFYNLFNRVQFATPAGSLSSGALFGFSTAQVGRPDGTTGARQIQLGAKILF